MFNIKINIEEVINFFIWIVNIELDCLGVVFVFRFSVFYFIVVGFRVVGWYNVDSFFKWWVSRNLVFIYNIIKKYKCFNLVIYNYKYNKW